MSCLTRWLHISDFHLKSGGSYDADVVLGALLNSLPNLIGKFGAPQFVIASGDIAQSGKPSEYLQATKLFDDLLDILKLSRKDLFVVPGNHDIDREKGVGLARTLKDTKEADAYFAPDCVLLHVAERLKAYGEWYDSYFEGIRSFDRRNTYAIERHQSADSVVEIGLFNTAAFCLDDHDNGKLFIGRRSVENAGQQMAYSSNAIIKLAVMHHPLNWLSQVESTPVKAGIRDLFDCILTGHLHENEVENVVGTSGEAIHLAAGACYQTRNWPNTALMCCTDGSQITITPLKYSDSPRSVWSLDTSLFVGEANYTGQFVIPKNNTLQNVIASSSFLGSETSPVSLDSRQYPTEIEKLTAQLQESLFISASGKVVYAEPRLMPRPQIAVLDLGTEGAVTVEEIAKSADSFLIETRPEYGGTTLARVLQIAALQHSDLVEFRNARTLPNYKKKLESEFGKLTQGKNSGTLILDDVDLERDERMLNELKNMGLFERLIMVTVNRKSMDIILPDTDDVPFSPKILYLWALGRETIRQIAHTILDTNDGITESLAVNKVYTDLLALRIPLTPSNVMMYLKVLRREGDFEPLSRVDILSRYLAESLRKPSDVGTDSFNFKNKMDVLSAFTFQMHTQSMDEFDDSYWLNFCKSYQEKTLTEFDASVFLHELVESRIFSSTRSTKYFRYSFYFNFFLGRFLWPRPSEVRKFFESDNYLAAESVIDVITGLSSENSEIVEILLEKLSTHLDEFGEKYVKPDFDPLLTAIWPSKDDEEETLWIPVQEAIKRGPADSKRIDELRSSMLAEARTANQQITYQKFTELEHALFAEAFMLADALKNADDVSRTLKIRAWDAILRMNLVVFQVGTMFAPYLAKRKRFNFGGISFVDFDRAAEGMDVNSHEAFVSVIVSLSHSIATKTSQEYGANKLSGLFRTTAEQPAVVGFVELVNFACLATSRGRDWSDSCTKIIHSTDKNAFYLQAMLRVLMELLEFEAMSGRDRDSMKKLVALIQAKRNYNKQAPGAKAVNKMNEFLEKDNYYPLPSEDAEAAQEPVTRKLNDTGHPKLTPSGTPADI